MTLPTFTVSFDTPGGPWSPTTDMLSLAMSAGRQNALDTYGGSTAELVFRRVSGNTANLDKLVPGMEVTFGFPNYVFEITDVINDYGIVANADTCTVTMEGALAKCNRSYLNNYNLAAGTLSEQLDEIAAQTDISISYSTLNDPQCDGTTVTSVADWLQKLVTTIDGRLDDTVGIYVYDRYTSEGFTNTLTSNLFVFTDGTVSPGPNTVTLAYDQMAFTSLGENYYTKVIVDPDNHAAQTSTLGTAVAPYRVLQLDTFNSSTGQAKDYADFLLSTYSDPTHKRIAMLSVNGVQSNASQLFESVGGWAIAKTVPVIFRGTTYNAVIEGWNYTATPDVDRYTFYFSGADLNNYLILDDTDRGVLDANRLGY